jgi:ABC-type multidrug transport system fused ATPase/permease subunit
MSRVKDSNMEQEIYADAAQDSKLEILRAPPMKLSWKDVNYKVSLKYTKKEMKEFDYQDSHYDKEILKNQSGYVNSGETLFIMGSSGAGKTTMLNAL